jgi:hypothetical protein
MRKTKAMFSGAFLALVTSSTVASAGQTESVPVFVDYSLRTAMGNLGTARNSSDNQQFIGCELQSLATDDNIWVTCEAQDARGNYVRCLSRDPKLAQVVAALNRVLKNGVQRVA